jgi:hypothetical protein
MDRDTDGFKCRQVGVGTEAREGEARLPDKLVLSLAAQRRKGFVRVDEDVPSRPDGFSRLGVVRLPHGRVPEAAAGQLDREGQEFEHGFL